MIASAQELSGVIRLPSELWEHALFEQSSCYQPATIPLAAAYMDQRIRMLRKMPSTSDDSAGAVLEGIDRVNRWSREWVNTLASEPAARLRDLLTKIERVCISVGSGVSPEFTRHMLSSIGSTVPENMKQYLPENEMTPEKVIDGLQTLSFLLLDYFLSRDAGLGKRYLKRVYCAVDRSLQFNATTDSVRIKPVLGWIRQLLVQEKRKSCSYVDVGCAMAGETPGLLLAAAMLRPGNVCARIHGTDIVPPTRGQADEMRMKKHILLYGSDVVERPLPRRYDVVLLANVHRHLDRLSQEKMLTHLGLSMNENGLLFINWRFDARNSPCLCLRKNGAQLALAGEKNLPV